MRADAESCPPRALDEDGVAMEGMEVDVFVALSSVRPLLRPEARPTN